MIASHIVHLVNHISTIMQQLLFHDRRDMKRATVGHLTHCLVDFRRTSDAKKPRYDYLLRKKYLRLQLLLRGGH